MRTGTVPVLMYHDVVSPDCEASSMASLTPAYRIRQDLFRSHLERLTSLGCHTGLPEELIEGNSERHNVLLTFDDGLIGVSRYALPLMLETGCRGIVFATVGSIGKAGFIGWREIHELLESGMGLGSHTVTHRPLESLGSQELRMELDDSKKRLEDSAGVMINSISFPHGSYTRRVIDASLEAGYRFMFTSDMRIASRRSFENSPAVVGRITMSSRVDADRLERFLICHRGEVARAFVACTARRSVRKLVGIELYRRVYRWMYGIEHRCE